MEGWKSPQLETAGLVIQVAAATKGLGSRVRKYPEYDPESS